MYRLELKQPMQLKQYWCANLQVAKRIADELKNRYGCDCDIVHVPQMRVWASDKSILEVALKRWNRFRAFKIDDVEFGCAREELDEALQHQGDIVKINDIQEVFCFKPNDTFWQRQYAYVQQPNLNADEMQSYLNGKPSQDVS